MLMNKRVPPGQMIHDSEAVRLLLLMADNGQGQSLSQRCSLQLVGNCTRLSFLIQVSQIKDREKIVKSVTKSNFCLFKEKHGKIITPTSALFTHKHPKYCQRSFEPTGGAGESFLFPKNQLIYINVHKFRRTGWAAGGTK